jgi:ABC-type nitrate/sulfonate/bicarbonate transport system substrate-binding protein
MKKVLIGLLVLAIIGGIVILSKRDAPGVEAPQYTLRIGHIKGTLSSLPGEVLRTTDALGEAGLAYEFVELASSNQAYEATVRGDVDLVPTLSFLPVAQNFYKQTDAVKLFGATQIAVADDHDYILVKAGSPFTTIADISGKQIKFGVFPGSTHTVFIKKYLEKRGVDYSKIEFVQMPPPTHIQALEAGAVDVLGTYLPTGIDGIASGAYRMIDHSVYAQDLDRTPLAVGILNAKFATEHEQDMRTFFKVYDETLAKIQSDKDATYDTIANVHNFSGEVARTIPFPTWLVSRSFEESRLQALIDRLVELKEIEKGFPASAVIIK